MRLAGLQKTSVIDFPDQIAAVVFTQGCNFYCPYCHNSQLIPINSSAEEELMPADYFFNFLQQRKNLLDGVTITGGEPLLQPDLKEFILKIKEESKLLIKLDTNGSRPAELKELIAADLIDYLAVDIKFSWPNYQQSAPKKSVLAVQESVKLIMSSDLDYEFRTTVVPGLHDSEEIEKIAQQIAGAAKYYIQNFRAHNTLAAELRQKSAFPPSKLQEFKSIAEKYLKKVEIRD